MWVDGEDGCGASDEREGNSGEPEKLLHGLSSLNRPVIALPLAAQAVCDPQHKKAHLPVTRVSLVGPQWRRSRTRAAGSGARSLATFNPSLAEGGRPERRRGYASPLRWLAWGNVNAKGRVAVSHFGKLATAQSFHDCDRMTEKRRFMPPHGE